ncbi:hypothetical protein ACTXT7_005145 [Hymenolepis weldensis]
MTGILTQREGDLIETTDPVAAQPFLPLVWATAISMRAEKDGYIKNPHTLVNLINISLIFYTKYYIIEQYHGRSKAPISMGVEKDSIIEGKLSVNSGAIPTFKFMEPLVGVKKSAFSSNGQES